MSHTLQFFVHNLDEHGINKNNNYPLFNFGSKEEAYNFMRVLKSEKSHNISVGHILLNNPHLLPPELRRMHMYKPFKIRADYADYSDDDKPTMFDGCYSIEKNSVILKSVIDQINNNSLEINGFKEFIAKL